jgi:Holliday junction resolvase RusA-like endonuclease
MSDTVYAADATGAAIREDAGLRARPGPETPAASAAPARTSGQLFRLTIHSAPVPKARPRAAVVNGQARIYTPATTRRYEDLVRKTALRDWRGSPLQAVAVSLLAVFYMPVPTSWPAWRVAAARAGDVVPVGRPDLDNLVKACVDGMTGVVFADDSLIVEERTAKRYDENPRVDLVLTWRDIPTTRAQWEALS